MALKIDLEKAYYKLEWSFIREMFIRVNLPEDLIDIIMSCIFTVSTSILFNREALDPIFPSREKEALWAQVLVKKYCLPRRLNNINADTLPCLATWKAIKKGMETFSKGSRWMVGRESNLKVWHSNWTSKGSLKNMIQGPLTWEANQLEIRDFLVDTSWDWSKIPFGLPLEIKQVIQATPISLIGRGKDVLAWSESPQGKFDLKSAYKFAKGFDAKSKLESKWIWKADTLPRKKSFLWQCAHNSIRVKAYFARRGVVEEVNCPICQEEVDTVLHALRDYSRVRLVWRKLGVKVGDWVFWESNLQTWINYNGIQNKVVTPANMPWKVVFPFAVWLIWKSRNHSMFRGKNMSSNFAADILKQVTEYVHCAASPRALTHKSIQQIRWERPLGGWKKQNTDGSVIESSSMASYGVVVRDEEGIWIAGFTRRIGVTTSFEAELWGLRDGLMFCSNLNISSLVVELDAKAIVDVLLNANYVNNVISPFLDDCRLLMTLFSRLQVNHCYREANKCADKLARMEISNNSDLIYFQSPPVDIVFVFENDFNGLYSNRLCPRPLFDG
ncbi:hypothetical protein SO802_009255 [Lithocarpus litseifolius]|uniref:RNase H type-1 domain-containing protein n=1 Tax=Lithocarpus litseifolius TaxID=425828 RepID=A0AAW2DDG4_9ROSI